MAELEAPAAAAAAVGLGSAASSSSGGVPKSVKLVTARKVRLMKH